MFNPESASQEEGIGPKVSEQARELEQAQTEKAEVHQRIQSLEAGENRTPVEEAELNALKKFGNQEIADLLVTKSFGRLNGAKEQKLINLMNEKGYIEGQY